MSPSIVETIPWTQMLRTFGLTLYIIAKSSCFIMHVLHKLTRPTWSFKLRDIGFDCWAQYKKAHSYILAQLYPGIAHHWLTSMVHELQMISKLFTMVQLSRPNMIY